MREWALVITYAMPLLQGRGQTSGSAVNLDSVLTILNNTHRFNGTVLYAENGKVLYRKAFGVTDFRSSEPLTTNSSFNLA